MEKMTVEDLNALNRYAIDLSKNLTSDIIEDLDESYKKLKEMFQDIDLVNKECDKLFVLNEQCYNLHSDMLSVNNEIKAIISDAESNIGE